MLQSHYASTLDFSNEALQAAEKGFKRLMASVQLIDKLPAAGTGKVSKEKSEELKGFIDQAIQNLSDDFNTAKAIASLFEISSKVNTYYQNPSELADAEAFDFVTTKFKAIINDVLGLVSETENAAQNNVLEGAMEVLINLRKEAKFSKNYALSDKIRDDLKNVGIQLKDEKGGETSFTID